MAVEIRTMVKEDWEDVKNIYLAGIATGNATFEVTAPSYEKWDSTHHPTCRFVAVEGNECLGWVSLSQVSNRSCYAGIGEDSIYIAPTAKGKGIGTMLLNKLIEESEKLGYWTLQTSIFPENKASLHLHEKAGFRVVGIREKIGKLNGVWRDVVFLERRSNKI